MKRVRFLLSSVSLLAAVLSLTFCSGVFRSSASTPDVSITNDVDYVSKPSVQDSPQGIKSTDINNRLDIYAPPNAQGAPVVMFVYGGGWSMGRKGWDNYKQMGKLLAEKGYVAVFPNYRLSGTAQFPAPMKDLAAAFAWTYNNIKNYGGDPNKIFLAGHSAGGHLATLLALDPRYLKEVNVPPNAIKGVLALSGIYDVEGMAENWYVRLSMVKPEFGSDPNVWREASPIRYVRPGLPPFLVLNAQGDNAGSKKGSKIFVDALRAQGNRVDVFVVKNKDHLSEVAGKNTPVVPPMVEFMNSVLKTKAPEPAVEKAVPAGPPPSTP